jgi:hypothetical protein
MHLYTVHMVFVVRRYIFRKRGMKLQESKLDFNSKVNTYVSRLVTIWMVGRYIQVKHIHSKLKVY